jgi:hypothetical protein
LEVTLNFHTDTTLAGYARTAVGLKTRMDAYCRSTGGKRYLTAFAQAFNDNADPDHPATPDLIDAVHRLASSAWRVGEPYVLAPAMTAIVAAAADALDLTGETLHDQVAPGDFGVLFLPDPIYARNPRGQLIGIAAITWARLSAPSDGSAWAVAAWSAIDDPDDPETVRLNATLRRNPKVRRYLGPYLIADLDHVPIDRPIQGREVATVEEADRDWEPAPDGRYVIDTTDRPTAVCTAVLYAFWRIQAQPLATVAPAPLDRPTVRRAARASIVHDTRVVMLRRTSAVAEPDADGQAKWHYRVRFLVRGHWRRLTDKQGRPYRIWIHAHIKGPDGAPLLAGEKVNILAR